jgi:hypothetical protein
LAILLDEIKNTCKNSSFIIVLLFLEIVIVMYHC